MVVSFASSITDHRGYLFTANRETRRQEREVERFDKRNLNVPFTLQTRTRDGTMDLSSLVWEVVVPTCSYRMGVQVRIEKVLCIKKIFTSDQEMGLGLMVVSKSGETFYANLWLPGRYCNHQSPTQEQNELPNGSCRSYHNVPAGIVITSNLPTRTKQTAVLKWKQLHSEL